MMMMTAPDRDHPSMPETDLAGAISHCSSNLATCNQGNVDAWPARLNESPTAPPRLAARAVRVLIKNGARVAQELAAALGRHRRRTRALVRRAVCARRRVQARAARQKGEPLRLDEDSRLESSDARPFAPKVVAAACGRELGLQASNSAEYLALWSALQAAMNVVTERSP